MFIQYLDNVFWILENKKKQEKITINKKKTPEKNEPYFSSSSFIIPILMRS